MSMCRRASISSMNRAVALVLLSAALLLSACAGNPGTRSQESILVGDWKLKEYIMGVDSPLPGLINMTLSWRFNPDGSITSTQDAAPAPGEKFTWAISGQELAITTGAQTARYRIKTLKEDSLVLEFRVDMYNRLDRLVFERAK